MASTITLTGNAGRDAELKYTPSGAAVLEVAVADTPRRKNDRGEWEDAGPTAWFRVSVWGALAEALANANVITKGAQVSVTGALTVRTYEKDGQARTSLDVRADSVGVREKRGAPRPAQQQQDDPWAAGGVTQDAPPW